MGQKTIAALAVILLLAGCATRASAPEDPRQIWCETNKPRRDATPETPRSVIDEINEHNAKGVVWCKWSP